jgi:hypothetical protein
VLDERSREVDAGDLFDGLFARRFRKVGIQEPRRSP